MPDFRIKRGGTLRIDGAVTDDAGAAYDLTGAGIAMELRDAGDTLIATPTITRNDAAGTFAAVVADSSDFPVGTLRGDLKVTIGADVLYSDTFAVRVDQRVTA